MSPTVFTIGHSMPTAEFFLERFEQHSIEALCDARSNPRGKQNAQFNRAVLQEFLHPCQTKYVFLGRELGARREDPACHYEGKISYRRLAQTAPFRQGLERVQKGRQENRVAIMRAEKEPRAGTPQDHTDALLRLARVLRLRENEGHRFCAHEEQLAEAGNLQEARKAYKPEVPEPVYFPARQSAAR
jgi:uncharacterized protein (DUF488 family)